MRCDICRSTREAPFQQSDWAAAGSLGGGALRGVALRGGALGGVALHVYMGYLSFRAGVL